MVHAMRAERGRGDATAGPGHGVDRSPDLDIIIADRSLLKDRLIPRCGSQAPRVLFERD